MLEEIDKLVKAGRYRSRNDFILKAIRELVGRMGSSGVSGIDVVRVLYEEMLKAQGDGAIVFSAGTVRTIMQKRGLRYDAQSLSNLVNRLKAYLRWVGWRYVGSYVIMGTKYHVFIRDGNNIPLRVLEIINQHEKIEKEHRLRRYYQNLAREIIDYVLKNPQKFIVNPTGVFKLTTKNMIDIAESLGIHGVKVSPWLVMKIIDELKNRGFDVRKEKPGKYIHIYFMPRFPSSQRPQSP